MSNTPITAALLCEALGFIPPSLPRDEWARVGMAIKSEFPDETGWGLFRDWSAREAGSFDETAALSTWRSIKAGGGVGVSTLLYLAKQHGFKLPRRQRGPHVAKAEPGPRPSDAELDAQLQAAHAAAAQQAATLWEAAASTGSSPYLQRKGVQGFGVRHGADGWLLVPLRDGQGTLWNVQRIAPERPAKGPDKLFLKGGRKSGLWHMLGAAEDASVVLLAEGYATAASLRQATGLPVAVGFDAGNLLHVARALHGLLPNALLVVCGDDDVATAQRVGRNAGRSKAEAAAAAVHGVAVFPTDLPDEGSDFNDMHRARGLQAVKDCVLAAIENHQQRPAQLAADPQDAPAASDEPFAQTAHGVWFHGRDKDGNPTRPLWLCSPLQVEALTRDQDGMGWGYLLGFADPLGKPKQWAMPARMLSGDGGEYRAMLLNMGLRIATAPVARSRLTEYIQTRKPGAFASCTDRIGWHGHAFVLPHETLGDEAERIVFQSDAPMENTFRIRHGVQDWVQRVGRLCAGNSRMVFAVSCAFAGPLLRPAGMESGGFHIRGGSSSGKTTAAKIAASVYGGPDYMQRWRTTDNALEAIAAQHCDSLLILDELSQVDGKVAGDCAYMLANEQSKARSTRTGMARARLTWRLLFLSTGELSLSDHMAEGGKRSRTGQDVRMADIPADAGMGMGAFECLHGHPDAAALAALLAREAAVCHGAVGHAFLEWATANASTLGARVREGVNILAGSWMPGNASGQVARVAARFALVGIAGALATEAGLTGWDEGESEDAAKACFDAWLAGRGGSGSGEVTAMLRQVRAFFEAHGEGRFTWWHRATDDHSVKTLQRAGFRRLIDEEGAPVKVPPRRSTGAMSMEDQRLYDELLPAVDSERTQVEFFVLPEVFRSEVCNGFDYTAVCKALIEHGCLKPGTGRHFDDKQRLPGLGPSRCYRITSAIYELEE
jgi:putative DNA primase/helicase